MSKRRQSGLLVRGWRTRTPGGHRDCRLPRFPQLLIRKDAGQNDGVHHGEVERAGNCEDIHRVLQDLKQRPAEHYADVNIVGADVDGDVFEELIGTEQLADRRPGKLLDDK